jgi:hypothetical protein
MNEPLTYLGLLALWLSGFLIGRYAVAQSSLQTLRRLQADIQRLNNKFQDDPMRAAIDTGQRSVLAELQRTLDDIAKRIH